MSRNTGYIQAIKRPYHNMIDSIVVRMRNVPAEEGTGRHSDEYIVGYEIALRSLTNANGSFGERLRSLTY